MDPFSGFSIPGFIFIFQDTYNAQIHGNKSAEKHFHPPWKPLINIIIGFVEV